jgi:hypothetical protein
VKTSNDWRALVTGKIQPVIGERMSKNRRFRTLFTMVFIVAAFVATVSAVKAPALSKEDLSWPPRPLIVPVSGASEYTDYHQRHPELLVGWMVAVETPLDGALLDECFDVSLSELRACRETSAVSSP